MECGAARGHVAARLALQLSPLASFLSSRAPVATAKNAGIERNPIVGTRKNGESEQKPNTEPRKVQQLDRKQEGK
jgi:hypothetical protein